MTQAVARVLRRLRPRADAEPGVRRGARGLGHRRPSALGRWDRGVDLARFGPHRREARRRRRPASTSSTPGRLTQEKGADLLAEAFLRARERDPRLHLQLAGGGPEEDVLRERLGEHATFLGWQEGDELAPHLRERRRLPVRLADRHVRAGAARGAGERAAGRRGRRGRAVLDRRRRPHRPAAPGGRRRARRRGRATSPAAPLLRRALAGNALARGAVADVGGGAAAASPPATGRRSRPRPPAAPRTSRVPRSAGGTAAARRRTRRAGRTCGSSPRRGCAIVDVALFYGERSGGIRTYLDAKRAWAARDRRVRAPRRHPARRAVAAVRDAERLPRAGRRRRAEGAAAPSCGPTSCCCTTRSGGRSASPRPRTSSARASSPSTTARSTSAPRACRCPGACTRPLLRRWLRHAYRDVDAVMSAVPTWRDTGAPRRPAAALRPRGGVPPAAGGRARRPRPVRRAARAREGRARGSSTPPRARACRGRCAIVGTGPLRDAVARAGAPPRASRPRDVRAVRRRPRGARARRTPPRASS